MQPHPLSELFPTMSADEYHELKESIRAYGLKDPIITYEGKILDGRNRWRACYELGIKPTTVEFDGENPLADVLAKNVDRRHLTPGQVAIIRAEARKRGYSLTLQTPLVEGHTTRAAANVVVEHGSPELIRAARDGMVSPKDARQIVVLPRKDHVEIVNEKDARKRRKLVKAAKDKAKREPKPEQPPREVALTKTKGPSGKKRFYSVKEWTDLGKEERERLIVAGFDASGEGMNGQTGTSIEWARWSHNTVTGCLHDCPYCYARDIAQRLYPQKFAPTFHPHRLAGPGSVNVPPEARRDESYRNVFANSMSDLFGQWVPADWIEATIEMARRNSKWNFLTLTKFPQRAAEFEFPDNWWMGTTVDAQARVENAEKAFAKVRCKTKWLSVEPLLEPLRFKRLDLFQWIVIGGASESSKTPTFYPPFKWVARLTLEAAESGCRVYHKTNLGYADGAREREFPWVKPAAFELPKAFRYLKGM